MALLGPNGRPLNIAPFAEVRPGQGGRVVFSETTIVDVDGSKIRFAPGVYLVIAEVDWDALVAKTAAELGRA